MENITTTAGLKEAIQLLEIDQGVKGKLLKDHFILTYESLKPLSLLRHTLREISSSPNMVDNLSGTAMGLLGGFLSKRLFVGTSGNLIRKLIGSFLQFGVTSAVAQNSDVIRALGQSLFQHFFHKKAMNS
jgi:hypothetical protein